MSANGYNTNSFTEIINAVTNVTNLVTDKDGRANGSNYTLSDEKTTSNEITYDDLGRVTGRNLFKKNAAGTEITNLLTTSYGYSNLPQYKTSNQVYTLSMLNDEGYSKLFSYRYDKLGNITNDSGVTYVYDAAGELTRVNVPDESTTVFIYDLSGNILSKNIYDYTPPDETPSGTPDTTSYVYDNTWKDKLVTYGGQSITYDNIGNPLSYYNGYTFSWEMGRQLAGVTGNSKTIGYKYNENGIRTQKTVGETTTTYMLNDSGRVDYQTDGTDSLYFRYNSDDTLIGFEYNNGME